MINMKSFLEKLIRVYSYIFFVLGIGAGLLGSVTLATSLLDSQELNPSLRTYPGLGLMVDTISWILWGLVFKLGVEFLRSQDRRKMILICRNLMGIFCIDILRLIAGRVFFRTPSIGVMSALQLEMNLRA